jgi:hypothetical protein
VFPWYISRYDGLTKISKIIKDFSMKILFLENKMDPNNRNVRERRKRSIFDIDKKKKKKKNSLHFFPVFRKIDYVPLFKIMFNNIS